MKEVTLPSGRLLKIGLPDFADAKEVFRIICADLRPLHINAADDVANLYKNLFCTGMASRELESAVMKCAKKCTLDGLKLESDSFEKEDHRADWLPTMLGVGREAINPFMKSLFAEYGPVLAQMVNDLASKAKTTTYSSSSDSSRQATEV